MRGFKSRAPPLKFLFSHPAHFIACGCGSGYSPFAPGTAGTLFAWLTYFPLRMVIPSDAGFALLLGLMFVLGVFACGIAGRHLGVVDHGAIVWDEIVPFWAILLLAPAGLAWQLAAFLVFRVCDILKPPPARYFDREVHNGFGVMMDDMIAAAYTLILLMLLRYLIDLMF